MPYSTGDLAKLCDVSVRTVQFYDAKGVLRPAALSEGGRRLYSEDDLKKLRLICLLKSLGLSLGSIRDILNSKDPGRVLTLLLDEQLKRIDAEIGERQRQKKAIGIIRESIRSAETVSVQSINGMERIMNGTKKLKKVYAVMLIVGIVMDIIEIGAVILWIAKGVWLPFAVGMPVVAALGCLLTGMYYRNAAYICPECGGTFRPRLRDFLFSKHTPRTRKLKCTECGYEGYCVETAAEKDPSARG